MLSKPHATSRAQARAQAPLPAETVESAPHKALALGKMSMLMAKLDNDPELLRQGQELIAQARAVLARQSGQAPKG